MTMFTQFQCDRCHITWRSSHLQEVPPSWSRFRRQPLTGAFSHSDPLRNNNAAYADNPEQDYKHLCDRCGPLMQVFMDNLPIGITTP